MGPGSQRVKVDEKVNIGLCRPWFSRYVGGYYYYFYFYTLGSKDPKG